MQLARFYRNQFGLGFQAMLVNEGLPQFIADRLGATYPLEGMIVGLLGMAFKAESDDPRFSLSYKLKKILTIRAQAVLTTDPYVKDDPALLPLDEVTRRSDALILCAPHSVYRKLKLDHPVIIVDIWNFWGKGSLFARRAITSNAAIE
jgi:UDP-N-acetyl-D-mannosaminuronic acid dehydrogenase